MNTSWKNTQILLTKYAWFFTMELRSNWTKTSQFSLKIFSPLWRQSLQMKVQTFLACHTFSFSCVNFMFSLIYLLLALYHISIKKKKKEYFPLTSLRDFPGICFWVSFNLRALSSSAWSFEANSFKQSGSTELVSPFWTYRNLSEGTIHFIYLHFITFFKTPKTQTD